MKVYKLRFLLWFILATILITIYLIYTTVYFTYAGLYQTNILQSQQFKKIQNLCQEYDNRLIIDPKANGRLMYIFPNNHPIYNILFQTSTIEKLRVLCGNSKLIPCLDIPIEYRKYNVGSSMKCHMDTKMLPDQLQYECVITLENTSDSKTIIKNWGGMFTDEITSKPNSLIVVKAHGVEHCVTTTTRGMRTILKFVLCER
jgi:hypothetical protein